MRTIEIKRIESIIFKNNNKNKTYQCKDSSIDIKLEIGVVVEKRSVLGGNAFTERQARSTNKVEVTLNENAAELKKFTTLESEPNVYKYAGGIIINPNSVDEVYCTASALIFIYPTYTDVNMNLLYVNHNKMEHSND